MTAWFKVGTVSVAADSDVVTFANANVIGSIEPGFGFLGPDGVLYEVTSVDDSDRITIFPRYSGDTTAAAPYRVVPTKGPIAAYKNSLDKLIDIVGGLVDLNVDSRLEAVEAMAPVVNDLVAQNLDARLTAVEDQAFADAPIYDDTAAGLAATGPGDQFRVENADSLIAYDVYDHDSGGAAALVVSVPSISALTYNSDRRGTLPNGADLDDITEPGTYIGVPNGGYGSLPPNFDGDSEAFFLTVHDSGAGESGGAVLQRLISMTLIADDGDYLRNEWTRRWSQNQPNSTLRYWATIKANSVTQADAGPVGPDDLVSAFSYRGVVSTGSFNDVVDEGLYIVTAELSDGPSGASYGGLLSVRNYGNSYAEQRYLDLDDPTDGWRRLIRPVAETYKPWFRQPRPPLSGKTIVCLGDSITELGDYPDRLGFRTGATIVDGGVGGARMGEHSQELYDPFSAYQIASYVKNDTFSTLTTAADDLFAGEGDDNRPQAAALAGVDWSTVDYVVVLFGTNDYSANLAIGSDSDTTGATFKGAINRVIEDILSTHKQTRLVFFTPLWRSKINGNFGQTNAGGLTIYDYADAIIDRCAAHNVPVVDLTRGCGINMFNEDHWLADGVHPRTGVGYQLVADKVASGLESRF